MSRSDWKVAALVAAMAVGSASTFVRAADEAKPASGEAKAAAKAADDAGEKKEGKKLARLTKPWNQLTLTEEQSTKIREIHAKALAEQKAIEEREKSDIMALLTDAQRSELKALADAEAAAKKAAPKKEKAAPKDGDAAKPAATKAP